MNKTDIGFGFSNRKQNSDIMYGFSGAFCPEATLFINTVGDIPLSAQIAYDVFIKTLITNNIWNKLKYCITCPPTLNHLNALVDLKTCTTIANYAGSGATSPPYAQRLVNPYPSAGFKFEGAGGYIKTGFIPAQNLTKNSSCIIESITQDLAISGNYDNGAFTTTSAFTCNIFFTGNLIRSQQYNNTATQGLASLSGGTGTAGIYFFNRRNNSFIEIGKDSTVIGTKNTSAGDLPAIEAYLACFNNAGSAGTTIPKRTSMLWYSDGLSQNEREIVVSAIQTFNTNMNRMVFSKQVIFDGNSHMVYWSEKVFRTLQYKLFGSAWQFTSFAVTGLTTTLMLTDAVTQVDPLYNANYTKNIVVAWEATNDIAANVALATVQSNYQTYCQDRRTAGFKVIAMPVIARNYGANQKYLDADSFNSWLLANWSTFADAYVPHPSANYWLNRSSYGSDPAYSTAINALCTNPDFYTDALTHLTELGYLEWGNAIYTQLVTL